MGLFKSKKTNDIPSIEPKIPAEVKTIQTFPGEMPKDFMPSKEETPKNFFEDKFPAQTRELSSPKGFLDEPFFVRIDKFETSKENLQKISERITELERIMNSFEEIKKREDAEVEDFKEQTKEIKDFLIQIDQNIFDKL